MQLSMYDPGIVQGYKSKAQITRVLTERWVSSQMYCPACLHERLSEYPPNNTVSDFYCPQCKDDFQLKSSRRPLGTKIVDGEYHTFISSVRQGLSPNFFIMRYSAHLWRVISLLLIPGFFVTPSLIEQRNPLSAGARRQGWVGCNFLLKRLPAEGRIPIIQDGEMVSKEYVHNTIRRMRFLAGQRPERRGWTADVLRVLEQLGGRFSLRDVYAYEAELSALHPENRNVRAKIRQQLQLLRDQGILRFRGRGVYERTSGLHGNSPDAYTNYLI